MKDYKRAHQLLLELYEIIRKEGRGWIDSYIRETGRILSLFEDYKITHDETILIEIDKSIIGLYTGRASLSEFYIMRENEEERIKLNKPLSIIGDELWKMFY